MSIDKTLLSGCTPILLLQLLSERDMYGYEMIDVLSERSKNVFELKVGTLYPMLHSLVKQDYLTPYEEEVNGKTRKYYSITLSGRKFLEKKTNEWKTYAYAVMDIIHAN